MARWKEKMNNVLVNVNADVNLKTQAKHLTLVLIVYLLYISTSALKVNIVCRNI